jgi:pantoate--beta-alanine ligase
MQTAKAAMQKGMSIKQACDIARNNLEADENFKVEYFEVRCGEKMVLMNELGSSCRLFAAAWLGDVRLIDNIEL